MTGRQRSDSGAYLPDLLARCGSAEGGYPFKCALGDEEVLAELLGHHQTVLLKETSY